MSLRIPKPVLFVVSFLVAIALYWPALSGTPIWDDNSFWFNDPVMKPDFSYWTIWRDFGWPVSVVIQKFLFSIWGTNYTYYHVLNLLLHFANSLLVYRLGRHLLFKHPIFYFLLFLFHPTAVISTAWMVQLKTLLCFFFGLSSMLLYLKAMKEKKWLLPSWLLFGASVASKSASLPLALFLVIIHLKLWGLRKVYLLIPFFLFAGWNATMILKSPVTTEASEKALIVTKQKDELQKPVPKTDSKPVTEPDQKPVSKTASKPEQNSAPENKVKVEAPAKAPLPTGEIQSPPSEAKTTLSFIGLNFDLIAQTLQYYFWQVILPLHTEPVKGLNYKKAGATDFLHIFFISVLMIIFWKKSELLYLLAGHFLILPFLGIIPAPFMNITWVSDQHLYLALPAFLAFWMRVLDRVQMKRIFIIPALMLGFFCYKTYKTTPYYKDSVIFYEVSLSYNPFNVPMAYNLTFAHIMRGDLPLAYNVASDIFHLAQKEPLIRENIYYPYIVNLYLQLKSVLERHEAN